MKFKAFVMRFFPTKTSFMRHYVTSSNMTSGLNAKESPLIKADDPMQESLMEESCIIVDENDKILGHASKRECHLLNSNGEALLHRAFSVFAFDSCGNLLLQRRSKFKVTFPLLWANTCCSHPLHFDPEMNGEIGARFAARRRLALELGVENVDINNMTYLTRVHYKAPSPGKIPIWGEHEVDYILFLKGIESKNVVPNINEVAETHWLAKENLQDFLNENNDKLTPWFKLIAHTLLPNWWNNLDNLESVLDQNKIHRL